MSSPPAVTVSVTTGSGVGAGAGVTDGFSGDVAGVVVVVALSVDGVGCGLASDEGAVDSEGEGSGVGD